MGLALAVGDVSFTPDGEQEGVNPCGVHSVHGVEACDLCGDDGLCDLMDEVAKAGIFLGWPAYDCERPDGVLSVVNGFDFEDRELVLEAVIA